MKTWDDLVQLVPPPLRSARRPDWDLVEVRLGTKLPIDYKWLVDRYGPGSFGQFLVIFQPGTAFESIQLEHQIEQMAWVLDYLRDGGEEIPYENSELLPFAVTDNGDTCYWIRHPSDEPDAWTVVVNEARGLEWSTFGHGTVRFLIDVLSKAHSVSVFPDDFPGDEPAFEPYEA